MTLRIIAIKVYRSIRRIISPEYNREIIRLNKEIKSLSPQKGDPLHLLEINNAYSYDYFKASRFGGAEQWDYKLSDAIFKTFKPKSVVDFGCGKGLFLKYFVDKKIKTLGFEGSINAIKQLIIPSKYVYHKDLRKIIEAPNKKFDIAISFEVAEHIEKEFAAIYINNLISFSDKIIFTAYPPGMSDRHPHHPNEQPIEYWHKLFNFYGYVENKKMTNKLRVEVLKIGLPWGLKHYEKMVVYNKNK